MKILSVLTLAAVLGLSALSNVQAQEYGAVINPSDFAPKTTTLNGFHAFARRDVVRIDRQQDDEAFKGAGIGGNPNGN